MVKDKVVKLEYGESSHTSGRDECGYLKLFVRMFPTLDLSWEYKEAW